MSDYSTLAREQMTNDNGVSLYHFQDETLPECQRLNLVLRRVADFYADAVDVRYAYAPELTALVTEYQITALPTLILFIRGKEVGRLVGFHSSIAIGEFIDKYLPLYNTPIGDRP